MAKRPASKDYSLDLPEIGVGELVALINQSFEYTMPAVTVVGELANLRISKGKWLYFDLKDDGASVKCFGTVFMLPGPLENGMLLKVTAAPRLHNLYGFSMNVRSIQPAGEGSIKKAAQLLQRKLEAEGLFDASRKRPLPYPPTRIGLVTSGQSAAYADFIKVLDARWGGVAIELIDVQVQGEPAPRQITAAIEQLNEQATPPEVIVLIRGGGSPEDLAAFSTEQVTRAVAASRVPTLVAIGHEVDTCLAELAADQRASTPSNAAELLAPDRRDAQRQLAALREELDRAMRRSVQERRRQLSEMTQQLRAGLADRLRAAQQRLNLQQQLLAAYDPQAALQRGYAIVRRGDAAVTSVQQLPAGESISIRLRDGTVIATVAAGGVDYKHE